MKRLLIGNNRFVLDTSVLVEYIIKKSPYRGIVEKLFQGSTSGKYELFINYLTLSETLYVVSKIYKAAGVSEPNEEALNYIMWLKKKTKIIGIDENIALKAGELKKKLRLLLPDCYVIATAMTLNAIPLFRKLEKEMLSIENMIRELGVTFLNELF
ncbi:MAG: PIN domain-containing protein [Staphylothermus sp.]|nr:PIN domain-containing protein [Staphylothermus sp.]